MKKIRMISGVLIIAIVAATAAAQAQRRTGFKVFGQTNTAVEGSKSSAPTKESAEADRNKQEASAASESDTDADPTGSWLGTVSYNEFDYSFRVLTTFNREGTMISAAEGDISSDFNYANSAQHGAWSPRHGNRFAFTYLLLVSDLQTGVLIATIRIRARMQQPNPNLIRGTFEQDEIYPDGAVFINTATGTFESRKIPRP